MRDPALEETWRQRLKDAKLAVDFAHNYVREIQNDIAADALPAADGNLVFARAIGAENAALKEYSRILRIFTDLIVNGKIPDDGDWRKAGSDRG